MARDVEPPLEPGRPVGPYVLERKLGAGTFGEVWLARAGSVEVALKIPTHPLFLRHLRRETVMLAHLEHPRIVKEIAFDPEHDPPYLAMEHVPGENLRQYIAAQKEGFKVRHVISVSEQVLDALTAIHAAGLVHRDLKPENILVTGAGEVKVIDLGLGRVVEAAMNEVNLSLSMVSAAPVEGTLAYMAPEQRWGGEVTHASDLFAFGVILFEMLTGKLPRGMAKPTDLVPDLSPRFDVLLRRALHADPAKRFPSAAAMKEAVLITLRERRPVPLPEPEAPEVAAPEVSLADQTYLEAASPYHQGDLVGGHQLVELLGRGGFGEVWRVERAGVPAAMKLPLGPRSRGKLRYERELAERLDHPRIPKVVEASLESDPPFLLYEFVKGRSLRAELVEHGRLEVGAALRLLAGMAHLVAHCHERDLIHRDLKPENFLLGADGMPYLLDFGLGRVEGETAQLSRVEASLATAQARVGTYDYMAPEQRRGDRVGPAADLYSLGVIAFEALAGCLPGGAAALRELVPEAPLKLERAVARLMDEEPAARGTAREARDLLGLLAVETEQKKPLPLRPRSQWREVLKVALARWGILVGIGLWLWLGAAATFSWTDYRESWGEVTHVEKAGTSYRVTYEFPVQKDTCKAAERVAFEVRPGRVRVAYRDLGTSVESVLLPDETALLRHRRGVTLRRAGSLFGIAGLAFLLWVLRGRLLRRWAVL